MKRTFLWIASAMLFTAAFSQARNAGAPASTNDPRAALRQIEAKAADAAAEADKLERAAEDVRLSWQTHSDLLDEISADINQMGKQVENLESEHESLAPWENDALAKAVPLLADAAGNTHLAIAFLNDNMAHLGMPGPYQSYAAKIQEDCAQAARLIQNYVKLEQALEKEKHLRANLGSQSGS